MKHIVVASVVLFLACGPRKEPQPPLGDQDGETPSCASWCDHARQLGCDAAKPTPKGAPCEEVCANTNTPPLHLDLACRMRAASCAAADACEHGS